jgi:hypothetical protein
MILAASTSSCGIAAIAPALYIATTSSPHLGQVMNLTPLGRDTRTDLRHSALNFRICIPIKRLRHELWAAARPLLIRNLHEL